jgi:S1-C subfamily serine protease
VAGSQAEKLGLKVNDVVLRISDQPITAPDQIRKAIAKAVQDKVEKLSLVVQRGGKEMKFTIQPGQLGVGVAALFAQPVFE